jgi:AcrR family transcriptional regulator
MVSSMSEAREAGGSRRPSPPPLVESLDADQRSRREGIVTAAVELLLDAEYEQIQMKDVSAAAGVALGTTYRYFVSKDHLLAEALLRWSQRFPTSSPEATGRTVDQLKLAYRTAARAFEPHPALYATMVVLEASNDPYAAPIFNEFAARQTVAFERYLPRLSPERRSEVVGVMSAVLDVKLRSWARGRIPMSDVYRMIDVAADLVLGR